MKDKPTEELGMAYGRPMCKTMEFDNKLVATSSQHMV